MIRSWNIKKPRRLAVPSPRLILGQTQESMFLARARSQGEDEKFPLASERGSVLLFIVGLCLVLLLVASTVVAVSSIYLEQARLQSLADQAATSAAKRVEGISAASEAEALVHLNSASVLSSTQTLMENSGAASDFSDLSISPETGVSGNSTVVVVLSATAHPPLLSIVVPDGVNITVTGKARATATQG